MRIDDPAKFKALTFCSTARAKRIAEDVLMTLAHNAYAFREDSEKFFLAEALLRLYYNQYCRDDVKWTHYRECKEYLRMKHSKETVNGTD